MKFVRTPDDRFENLPDYDFSPHYTHFLQETHGRECAEQMIEFMTRS